jgi:hypothetical protein
MQPKPRRYTEEEVRTMFLNTCWSYIDFWDQESTATTCRKKLEGVVFSILAMIDGSNGNFPGMVMTPNPHPDDKSYKRDRGENWFPDKGDIAGSLHEHFYKVRSPRA